MLPAAPSSALQLLQEPPPPPRLQVLILKHASVLLPRTFPEYTGPLRGHPVVKMTHDLADLLRALGELEGRHPSTAAAALLAMGFAAHGGARPSAAGADVAALLGLDRHSVQAHVRDFEAELGKLQELLPFAAGVTSKAQLVPHAPLLLRLHQVLLRAQSASAAATAAAQTQAQTQAPGAGRRGA